MVAAISLRASTGSASTQERISTPSSEMPHSSCQPFAIQNPLRPTPAMEGLAPCRQGASAEIHREGRSLARPPPARRFSSARETRVLCAPMREVKGGTPLAVEPQEVTKARPAQPERLLHPVSKAEARREMTLRA